MRLILVVFLSDYASFWEWVRGLDAKEHPDLVIARHEFAPMCAEVFMRRIGSNNLVNAIGLISRAPGVVTPHSVVLHRSDTNVQAMSLEDIGRMTRDHIFGIVQGSQATPPPPGRIAFGVWQGYLPALPKPRLIIDLCFTDMSRFRKWLETYPDIDSPLFVILDEEGGTGKVYTHPCPLDTLYGKLLMLVDAPGIRLFTIIWKNAWRETLAPEEVRQRLVSNSVEILGLVESEPEPSVTDMEIESIISTHVPQPRVPPDNSIIDASVVKALLASVDVMLLYPLVDGRCCACPNDMAFMAHPCEEMTYCIRCMEKHMSCPDLKSVCPVCYRRDATFEKLDMF